MKILISDWPIVFFTYVYCTVFYIQKTGKLLKNPVFYSKKAISANVEDLPPLNHSITV